MISAHRQAFLGSLLLVCSAIPVAMADTDLSPENLIRQMSKALTELNYEGSFVHVQNGNIEAMSIVHSSEGEREYMLSLNGEAREVFRDHSLVTCIWPGSKSVIVTDSKTRSIIPTIDESLASSSLYELAMGAPDRVAGLQTHVVDIKPRDEYRYGYRLWIDKATYMLLRSVLLDNDNNPIEQVMFTDISYPESISSARFKTPEEKIKNYSTRMPKKAEVDATKDRVSFSALPMGYAEISETFESMAMNESPMTHVMLSDGMASVSVYVEYVEKASQADVALGMSSMGGMSAYTHSLPNALITVVGEVPPTTVQAIAKSVRLVE